MYRCLTQFAKFPENPVFVSQTAKQNACLRGVPRKHVPKNKYVCCVPLRITAILYLVIPEKNKNKIKI